MSEDRETHEITTPKGHSLVLRSWINGREKQRIDGSMFSDMSTEGAGNSMRPKMSGTMISNRENACIEVVVVSVDGKEIDVLNRVLDMRVSDFEYVLKRIDEIVSGDFDEKKENGSETSTTESLAAESTEESTTNDSM